LPAPPVISEDFVGAKFYSQSALADVNERVKRTRITIQYDTAFTYNAHIASHRCESEARAVAREENGKAGLREGTGK